MFGISIWHTHACVKHLQRGAYIQGHGRGCLRWIPQISIHNKRFRVGERPSFDGGLRPFDVTHGIGQHEVKVVGDHHSAKNPYKGPGDSHHVWVKLCTPIGLNLFKKPCPRLRMTWRRMPDHREL
jgi:hypothetical protein